MVSKDNILGQLVTLYPCSSCWVYRDGIWQVQLDTSVKKLVFVIKNDYVLYGGLFSVLSIDLNDMSFIGFERYNIDEIVTRGNK